LGIKIDPDNDNSAPLSIYIAIVPAVAAVVAAVALLSEFS